MDRWDGRAGQSFAGARTKEFLEGKNGEVISGREVFLLT
jgi:hypothetical protein